MSSFKGNCKSTFAISDSFSDSFSNREIEPTRHTENGNFWWIRWITASGKSLTNIFNSVMRMHFDWTFSRNLAFLAHPNHALFGWVGE